MSSVSIRTRLVRSGTGLPSKATYITQNSHAHLRQCTVMAIDPSGRGKDETTYTIVKFLNGYVFLMDIGGYMDGYTDTTLTLLAQKAKFWGVNQVIVEANFGDGMFTKIMTPIFNKIHPCGIEEVRHSKQKELRIIDTLEPVLMRHKLIVNQTVIEEDYRVYGQRPMYSFIYQLTRICRDKNALGHDDRLDAVTMAVAYWLEQMAVNEDDGFEELTEEELEDWLNEGILPNREERYENKCVKNIQVLRK